MAREIVTRTAEHPGKFAKSFALGAAKQAASNLAQSFSIKPGPSLAPKNDVERAGGTVFNGAARTATYAAAVFGGRKGGSEVIDMGPNVRTPSVLPNEALVVRGGSANPGGANSVEGIAAGTDTHPSGVTGFSVESAAGKSLE